MQPEPDRSRAIVERVVAWHNRHPLAERVSAAQVHSVGVVSLPFAVAGAVVAPPQASAPPETVAAAVPPAAEPLPPGEDSTLVELVVDPEAAEPPAAAADADADAADISLDLSPTDTPPPAQRREVSLPPRPSRWRWRDAWQRLRGRHPYRALFSEDFIAPLRPRRVAAWAAEHGAADWPLAPDAPLRQVLPDPSRRPGDDSAPRVDLHLVTAAIGLGERRVRLLLAPGPDAAVIGTRHWSRARLAAAGAPMALMLIGALVGVVNGGARPEPAPAAVAVAAAPSAPAVAAATSAPAVAAAPSAPVPPSASAAAPAPAAAVAEAPAPPDAQPRRGRVELPPLVPRLAGGERQALRQAAQVLRGPDPQAPPPKAYALATRAFADRGRSERAAAQLQALALLHRMPMRAELMQTGREWRAVFWPFTTPQDAEKVRLALADKGLRTEVIEF